MFKNTTHFLIMVFKDNDTVNQYHSLASFFFKLNHFRYSGKKCTKSTFCKGDKGKRCLQKIMIFMLHNVMIAYAHSIRSLKKKSYSHFFYVLNNLPHLSKVYFYQFVKVNQ